MDHYLAMRCFCRVVETGSLAAAARDLDCSRSVVSKYVQQLEAWTGSRLLARTTRRVRATESGERFYAYCKRVAADTEQTLGDIRGESSELAGRLVVALPASLTLAFLNEHLHAFRAAHPRLELELWMSDVPVDLVREGVDVALRSRAQLDDSSLVATPLTTIERSLCAAPAYWARHGKPVTPDELALHNCLVYLLGAELTRWSFTGGEGAAHTVVVRGDLRANNSLLLVDAMLRGAGVGLVPSVLVADHLRHGKLETALPGYRPEPRTLYAVYPSRQHLPRKVRRFVDFLRARLMQGGHPP